jgi:hypothetical protein
MQRRDLHDAARGDMHGPDNIAHLRHVGHLLGRHL